MVDSYIQVPPDSTGKQVATNEVGGKQYQVVNLADDTGAAIAPLTDAQLRATPLTVLIDSVDNVALGTSLTDGDIGLVTNTVIHGKTTAGGGSFVDVKVTPSGAMAVSHITLSQSLGILFAQMVQGSSPDVQDFDYSAYRTVALAEGLVLPQTN